MVAALYRRYRPETFAELIGQSQVTDPLRTALRTDRVNHAYLFSGPRGCGKTTSARILARCLNCAEGPTDTPCGVCPSCVELSRDGSGSLDVVEIDAASHNGVDDARDLRERAVFAPARDRFKIFILDEAHMVTPQGFNALLKIVEEPPEHVKFIFATTEPEKVIGTIRSRTHHYPFRLVPPAQMLDYVQQLCTSEGIEVEPGVLPLVVRAGGGSVRDTLSLLDQLMAGSEAPSDSGTVTIEYERAVALLGYTHGALLDEVVEAFAARDAAAVFSAIDRVIQTGQDPRRFVEDLLERLRDLIVVAATSGNAAAVLRGVPQDQLDRMTAQAASFGAAELSRAADAVNTALTEMTGATSPRLHLELMAARILVPASDDTERGALARVERLERRIGVADAPAQATPTARPDAAPTRGEAVPEPTVATEPTVSREAATAPPAKPPVAAPKPVGPVTLQHVKDSWLEILDVVKETKLNAWMVVYTARPLELRDGKTLVLSFPSQKDVDALKQPAAPGQGVGELLKKAFVQVLGLEPAFIARVDAATARTSDAEAAPADPAQPPAAAQAPAETASSSPAAQPPAAPADPPPSDEPPMDEPPADDFPPTESEGWAVAAIPDAAPAPAPQKPEAKAVVPTASSEPARYGESVVRELLGASFIEEQTVAPRVVPRAED
ncbi:DNA polymerase III subunit gamma and tau [Leifsonia sp. H3M29-4]|uniref:DNA polymerase III subunit gamma and tau n=1 Tax=Salinibacterium metalliresistens TaxID=3031321 RepID=UPI0023DCC1C5|nr:DNA polymerase III subunit gamma and tau [Salinibacterium metalliresistens]MDF1479058.1 DNA polymerase III subunit gamma and tau [Salinibacterium metalliresistens]